jgi:hypothetical protein
MLCSLMFRLQSSLNLTLTNEASLVSYCFTNSFHCSESINGCLVNGSSHYKKLFILWRILRDVFRKHHECALWPRTLWRFVKFVVILWRIPIFRHGCALKPKTLRRFVKFVAILWRIPVFHHRCALMDIKAQNITTIVKFVAIQPIMLWRFSRFVTINK